MLLWPWFRPYEPVQESLRYEQVRAPACSLLFCILIDEEDKLHPKASTPARHLYESKAELALKLKPPGKVCDDMCVCLLDVCALVHLLSPETGCWCMHSMHT